MEKRVFQNSKFKDRVTVLKSSKETNNEYLLLEIELDPKGGNGLHYHTSFSEEFIPVNGDLGVRLGKDKVILKPGNTSTVKAGQLHHFFNPGNEAIRFHVKIVPGHEGFLQGIKIAYGLAEEGLTNATGIPKKLDHLALLLKVSDTRAKGLLGLIVPLLMMRAKKAERKGVLKELTERYC
jgi:mannose-6-phosphate isomerase-like protein (cupin superfamily)